MIQKGYAKHNRFTTIKMGARQFLPVKKTKKDIPQQYNWIKKLPRTIIDHMFCFGNGFIRFLRLSSRNHVPFRLIPELSLLSFGSPGGVKKQQRCQPGCQW
jgi:hypothetical protein